jgi:hypothetical protein
MQRLQLLPPWLPDNKMEELGPTWVMPPDGLLPFA